MLHSRLKIPHSKSLTKTFQTRASSSLQPFPDVFFWYLYRACCGFSLNPQATFRVKNAYRAWNKLLGQGYNLFSPSPGSTPKHKYPKGPWKHQKIMEKGARSFPPGAEPVLTYLSANHSIPFCS